MKRTHIVGIAVAALAILLIIILIPKETSKVSDVPPPAMKTAADSDQTAAGDPALVIDGARVSPLCFISRGDETSFYLYKNCENGGIASDPQAKPNPLGDDMVSTVYLGGSGEDKYRGLIGYRHLGASGPYHAMLIVENSGGSGIFSALALLEQKDDRLEIRKVLATGDRCNGGIAAAEIINGSLLYVRDVTPFDMMSLAGDPGRPILQTDAARQIPSCSICCYGRAHYVNEKLTGFTFLPGLGEAIAAKTYGVDSEVEQCFDRLVTLNLESEFDADGLEAFIRETEHVCLGRPEGE